MLERASGSLPNYPGHPPAAAGGLVSADTRSHSFRPRKPLDFGELQQPVRRDTTRFFGTRSQVPTDWAAPAIKLERPEGCSTTGAIAIVHFGTVGRLQGLFERSKAHPARA